MSSQDSISKELTDLVSWSVSLLGKAIRSEYGEHTYQLIEGIRHEMKSLRSESAEDVYQSLDKYLTSFKDFQTEQIHQLCNSYALMLELINRCETSYRAYRPLGA